MASREKRYAITMAIRMACFVSMIFVDGPMRWVLLGGAVFLPYIAVVLANQANTKSSGVDRVPAAVPTDAPALTTGPVAPEIIEGELFVGELTGEGIPKHHVVSHDHVRHDQVRHDQVRHDRVQQDRVHHDGVHHGRVA